MNVVPLEQQRRLPQSRGGIAAPKLFLVVEVVPGGRLKVTEPNDLKWLAQGRIEAREFAVVETEEEGIATASTLAAENPGRCFLCVEAVAAAFEVAR
jgi:hypothetical protein